MSIRRCQSINNACGSTDERFRCPLLYDPPTKLHGAAPSASPAAGSDKEEDETKKEKVMGGKEGMRDRRQRGPKSWMIDDQLR